MSLQNPLHIQMTESGKLAFEIAGWEGFSLSGLVPALWMDETLLRPTKASKTTNAQSETLTVEYAFGDRALLVLEWMPVGTQGIRLRSRLRMGHNAPATLNKVALLETDGQPLPCFGLVPESVRILIQSNYRADILALTSEPVGKPVGAPGEPNGACEKAPKSREFRSQHVGVFYDRLARRAFLAGFETSERWNGHIAFSITPAGTLEYWRIGFDGGDLRIEPYEELILEEALFMAGPDPWALLEAYGEAVQEHYHPAILSQPPVSWCSWYPYRLAVTEERLLETARIAARRLHPLGLRIIEADLGWEREQLPSMFEENDQFPHGLKWLAAELRKLGFDLGVWKAPYTISEFDPLVREHPEWLVPDETGQPAVDGTWFWPPHGKVYCLDLTHPGAQDWLRQKIRSLAERGVRYFKADFIGCVSHIGNTRYDRKIVAGGGCEAARIGARIIREELPDALILNCGGPDMPGPGQWPLLYTCDDTGNTGFITWEFHRKNFRTVACHLFKNRRWGIIQPSCLCVGLPGTIEEARLRATVAFLSGGQVDISDTLTSLPEDRWQVLLATLPPLGITACPIDLFDPIINPGQADYVAICKGGQTGKPVEQEHPPGSVWHVHIERDWDRWDLVGVFAFDTVNGTKPSPCSRFVIPFARLGLDPDKTYWAYEFWSGQFLGAVPVKRHNVRGYTHPGDNQDLTVGDAPGTLDIAFVSPGVKLVCLRSTRQHPWVVGTSFHQSCGTELSQVCWQSETLTLTGWLMRPEGEMGLITFTDAALKIATADVAGQSVRPVPAANGAWCLPVVSKGRGMAWKVMFQYR